MVIRNHSGDLYNWVLEMLGLLGCSMAMHQADKQDLENFLLICSPSFLVLVFQFFSFFFYFASYTLDSINLELLDINSLWSLEPLDSTP